MTNEQLKQSMAAMAAHLEGKPIECCEISKDEWWQTCDPGWNFTLYRYRQKPEPKARPWSSPDDVPAFCWLKSTTNVAMLVVSVSSTGVTCIYFGHELAKSYTWDTISRWEYSTDRRTWFKCEVQE